MTTGLRERKRVAVERALRTAAFQLMAEHAADEVTIEQIAAAADVSARTFFNYFATKDELFTALKAGEGEEFVERVLEQSAGLTPLEALSRVIAEDLLRMEQEETDWTLWLRVIHRNPQLLPALLTRLGETEHTYAVAVATRSGQQPSALYPRLVAGCAMSLVRAAIALVIEAPDSASVLDGFAAGLRLVSSGLVPEVPS